MSKPLISVIMPVYNAEKFLDESIQSILSQSFRDFEFIIVNDGSTDNTLSIIKKYQKKDKRIRLVNNPKNLGLQKTLNRGLKAAKGKYIARTDADDVSIPERLKIQYNYLENHPEIFLIGTSAIIIDEDGNRMGVFRKYDNYKRIRKKLLRSNCIIHPSIMFRNLKILYREKFKTSEDYDFYLRLLSSGRNVTNIPNFLIKYRITKNSFVSTMKNQKFYYKKAKEFYWQRIKDGKDDYDKLDKIKIPKNQEKPDFEKNYLQTKILVQFQDNQMGKARRGIRLFSRRYGFDSMMSLYYLLSFFPYKLIDFMKKNIL